jgi:thiol-disulfide isomerase/thioredoxin
VSPAKHALTLLASLIALAAAFLVAAGAGLPNRADFTGERLPGQLPVAPERHAIAPPFSAPTLDDTIALGDLRGQPVILNFWATWCGPCRVEMPILQDLYDSYADAGLRILAVNLGEPPRLVEQWRDQYALTYDLILDRRGTIAAQYRLRGQPSTYVISPNGIITHIYFGPVRADQLASALQPYIDPSYRED